MESPHLIAEQRAITVRSVLRNNATASYDGCRIYIPSANIPIQDPDFITFDTIAIFFGTSNAFRYVLRSNITDNDVFYSFLGISNANATFAPQVMNILVKPTKPISYIEILCNVLTPIATSVNGFNEQFPSVLGGNGDWFMTLKMTFYKMKKSS